MSTAKQNATVERLRGEGWMLQPRGIDRHGHLWVTGLDPRGLECSATIDQAGELATGTVSRARGRRR